MKRRTFLQNIGLLTGGASLGLTAKAVAPEETQRKKSCKGFVRSGGKGLKGVVVSDGHTVVSTNRNGKFEIEPHKDSVALFVSTPSGYSFEHEKGIARHYRRLEGMDYKKDVIFDLVPLDRDDTAHQFFIWADPQVKNAKDVEKMMAHSVPDVQKQIRAAGAGTLLHGITVGDICWDELVLFADYNKAVEQMGIPFFQCLGNHDMDYRQGGDDTSDKTFKSFYGPTYYSFNRGKVHYVVLDDVRYLGTERDYDGFITKTQLDWLQKDLAYVPQQNLIVLCLHIPVHLGVKNKADLYAILGSRTVHIMSGHTHWHDNVVTNNIYEHNHGTVCGAWWTGSICGDGTPNGYGIYQVNGTDLTWHYQATGQEAEYQLKAYVSDFDASKKQVKVNIWNYDPAWKTEYSVDGEPKGPLEQFEGFDPKAYETLSGPSLPKARGFAEPIMTKHLFRAFVPITAKEVVITATDRFGKQYTIKPKITG